MNGPEQMDVLGALTVLVFFGALIAVVSGCCWLAWRCGWLEDPAPLPWETPGGRNDRERLLEDEVR